MLSMRCIGIAAVLTCAGLASSPALGQDVTRPGNTITGVGGTVYGTGETPVQAIDNNANTKYLNFAISNTGFLVTPTGTGAVQALTLITANDSPPRDPASFTLEGTNDGTNFTLIASGTLNPPSTRWSFYQALFSNNTTYTQYRVVFPTVRTPLSANSMQVGEVQLNTFGNILSPGDAISATLTTGQSFLPAEGPAGLIDGTLPVKFNVTGGNLGPITVNITPAVGASIITGIDLFSANDTATFPNRTPPKLGISGSNDGVNYTPITTLSLTQTTVNYSDQQYTFANTTSYTRYRLTCDATTATSMQLGEIQLLGTTLGAAPANDLCVNAPTVTNGTTSGSTFFATGTDDSSCGTGDASDVWFKYTATLSGLTEINTCGAGTLDTVLSVYNTCGGAEVLNGCNDNACLGKSRVRFTTVSGQQYLIRVAGVGGATGSFTLDIVPNPVLHNDVPVTLAHNFNGIVHPGESGIPDDLNGYRSISDRGFRLTGTPGSIDVGLEGTEGIPYSIVAQPFVVDMVMLGNRNTVNTNGQIFDTLEDGDNFGIQPTWLPNVDLTGPQTTSLTGLGLAMGASTRIGTIFHASNAGNTITVTLGFTDSTSVQVNFTAPDWFGVQVVAAPAAGVATQVSLGTFFGAAQVDKGLADTDLNLVEAVISTASLIAGGKGDTTGRQLASIAFSNRTNANSSVGIFAMTVRDAVAPAVLACCDNTTGLCSTGTAFCPSGTTAGAGSTCSPSPCTSGSCCTTGACSSPLTSAACTGGGGVFQGNNSTCAPDPCTGTPTGACCTTATGACNPGQDQTACLALGGTTYGGDNSTCSPNNCPQIACCLNGACSASIDGVCQGGSSPAVPAASGACSPQPCPQPTGACCNGAGGCSPQTAANCTTPAGAFQGVGVACGPTNCGVCCRGSTCVTSIFTAAGCTLPPGSGAGASYVGGVACGGANHKVPCCYADYNKVGGKTVADIFAYLTDWFAHGAFAWNGTPGPGGAGNPPVSQIFAFLSDWFAGC